MTNGYKRNLCIAYNHFCKFYQIEWNMPTYKPEEPNHIPPTKEKALMLIAASGTTQSLKLKISMEAGLRPVELCRLKVKDVNFDHKVITPKTAKNGNPRTLPISPSLTAAMQDHIIKRNLKSDDKLFHGTADDYGKNYRAMRNIPCRKTERPLQSRRFSITVP